MKFIYPIKGKSAEELYRINREGQGGFYPLGSNNTYHGGLHFEGNHPLMAIADGQVIAYRYKSGYEEEEVGDKTYKYSSSFVLIRHHYKSQKEQELIFYSLYHHLRPWNECTENERGAVELFGKPGFEITASSLNVRDGMGTDKNRVGSLGRPEKAAATKIDDTWARLDDGPLKGNYFAHTYNGRRLAKPVVIPGEPELDDIITCTIDVKAGALLGYTGLYEAAGIGRGYKTVHMEIFAGKDAESFITNPKKEGKVSHLIVSAGTVLKKKSPQQNPAPEFTRPAGCEVERIDENDDGDLVQVKDKKVLGNVAYAWLNDKYNHGHNHYTAKTAHLADMQSAFPGVEIEAEAETTEETAATRFKWISHAGPDHRNIYTLPSPDSAAMYWVKKANLSGNKFTGNTPCYATPFELEDGDEVPDEHAVPVKDTVKMYHEDGLWYRVKVPGAHGWVAKDDVKEATPFDWPGFRVLEEKESTFSFFFRPEDDHTVDYDNLPEFFQKLVDEIDANDDGKVSREEIRLALKQELISRRLSRLICVHPSEWWVDNEKSFWNPLLDMLGGNSDAMEKRLENLCWWEQVKGIDGFPESPKVYHWNPVAFVEHMRGIDIPFLYPLKSRVDSYHSGKMGSFGYSRSGGRLHGACDLYASPGTEILAVKDGVVVSDVNPFYLGTCSLVIDHGDFIARYGEIQCDRLATGVRAGAKVTQGQVVAYVGMLEEINMSMLHLEMYSKQASGPLTVRENMPYQRRSDLIDPTPFLTRAEKYVD